MKNQNPSESRTILVFTSEKNRTSNLKPQRCVSFTPKFPPFICACNFNFSALALRVLRRHSTRNFFLEELFWRKSEKPLGNWSRIVSYISLSMKRIEESRLNNSEKGKVQRDVSKLCSLSELLCLLSLLKLSLYSNRPFYFNSFIFNCAFKTKSEHYNSWITSYPYPH